MTNQKTPVEASAKHVVELGRLSVSPLPVLKVLHVLPAYDGCVDKNEHINIKDVWTLSMIQIVTRPYRGLG